VRVKKVAVKGNQNIRACSHLDFNQKGAAAVATAPVNSTADSFSRLAPREFTSGGNRHAQWDGDNSHHDKHNADSNTACLRQPARGNTAPRKRAALKSPQNRKRMG
jgi:hypothetical protein